ncbi:hypothetical protein [Streptomyces sp. NBC_01353]|uniref:hypothetical protein n=1 Tax=Streptomyces sp. NBC_01353 TaxID=2903835 RepID=UPI002E379A0A|nr:hypothetical protein [Streptomyces sp. NBC_01353]
MKLLPRAAAALILGVAAAACTDDSPPPNRPTPPAGTASPAPTSTATTGTPTPTPTETTTPPVPPPAPAVLTQDDTGRTITLALGETTQLRLSGRWRETTPTVEGTAIVLVPVDHESDPGFRAWDIRAAEAGEAVLHTTEEAGLRPLRITFRIR